MFSNITGINTTAANLDTVNKLNVKENETIIEIGNLFQDDNGTAVDKVDKDDKLSILEQIEDLKKQIEELEKQLNNKNDIIISTDTDNSAINDLFLQEQAVFEYSNYSIKTSEGIKALNIKTLNLYYNHNEDDFTSGNYRIIDKQGNVIDLKQIANDNDDGTSDSMLQQNLANGNWIIQAAKYGGDGKIKHDKSGNIMYISISLSHSKAFGTKGVSSAAEKAGQDAPVKNTGNTKSTNNTSNSDNIGTASNIKTQEQQIADEYKQLISNKIYTIKNGYKWEAATIHALNKYYNGDENDFESENYRIVDKQGNIIDLKSVANDNDNGTPYSKLQENLTNGSWIIETASKNEDGSQMLDNTGKPIYQTMSSTTAVSDFRQRYFTEDDTFAYIRYETKMGILNILGNHITGNTTTDSTDLNAKLRAIKQEIYEKQIEMLQNLNNYDKKTKDENE